MHSDREVDPNQLPRVLRSTPQNAKDRNEFCNIERRTLRVRRSTEAFVENLGSADAAHRVAHDIYGVRTFKCRKINCQYYFEGFATRSDKDCHMDRHDRHYKCVHRGCPHVDLGFEAKNLLERHMKNKHSSEDVDSYAFPKPPKKHVHTLCEAAARGNVAAVNDLLDQGSDVNQFGRGKNTPLILAAQNSHIHVCRLLLQRGANVNMVSSGTTALHTAVMKGNIELLQDLLATDGVNLRQLDLVGNTPLMIAVKNGPVAIVRLLLDSKKADVFISFPSNIYILDLSAWSNDLFEMLADRMIKAGMTLRCLGEGIKYHTTFIRFFKILIRMGIVETELSRWNEAKGSVLHSAITKKAWDVVEFLIQSGKVALDIKDENGNTPLNKIVEQGSGRNQQKREEIIEMLVATEKLSEDGVDFQDLTPLIRAIDTGEWRIVEMFLRSRKFDLNAVMAYAIEQWKVRVIFWLWELGGIGSDIQSIVDLDEMIYNEIQRGEVTVVNWLQKQKLDIFYNKRRYLDFADVFCDCEF